MTAAIDHRIAALAEQLDELRQAVADRTPQLGHSSLHDGSIGEYVGDQLVARYGRQHDGAHTAVSLAGPTPPTPAAPQAMQIPSGFAVRWGGDWQPLPAPNADEVPTPEIAPSDFTRVEVHLGTDPTPGFLFTTYRKPIESSRGGEVEITGLDPDVDHYIWLVARTQSGKFSEPSQVVGPVRPGKLQANQLAIDLDAIGGNTIHRGPDEPTGEHKLGDLWLQTPDNVAHRWEGDPPEWTPSRDAGIAQAIADAFAASQAAEQAGIDALAAQGAADGAATAASDAQADADAAATLAAAAQGTAAGKVTAFRQASAPSTTDRTAGDLWIDSDDGIVYVWDGAWTASPDQRVGTLVTSNATKVTIFAQDNQPATTGRTAGDLWIDTNDGNKMYVWTGSWTVRQLGAAAISATARQLGAITTYRQATAPASGMVVGDFWIDSDDNKLYRYEGTTPTWVAVQDVAIQTAITNAATAQSVADGKMRIFPQASAPAGLVAGDVGDLWIDTDDGNKSYTWALISGTTYGWVARQLGNSAIEPGSLVAKDVIATGTVTAALLEAIMVLASAIIGGNPAGNHVRLDETGMRIFSIDPDGQVVESGRWGTGGGDRFLMMKSSRPVASIDQDGGGSFTSLDVDGDISMGGRTLNFLLDNRPRGLVARAGVEVSTAATTTALGAFDVEFTAVPGRAYRIYTSTLNLNPSTAATYGYASLICRPSAAGPPALSAGLTLVRGNGSVNIAGGIEPFVLQKVCSFAELFPNKTPPNGQVPTKVRILLAFGVNSGGGSISLFGGATYPIHLYVEDVGPEQWFTGVANNGGGSTVAPVVSYEADWAATWGANWQSNSSARRTDQSELLQGYTSYNPAGGSAIGQIGFGTGVRNDGVAVGDFLAELASATIQWAAIYLYSTYWTDDTGGEVILGRHAYTAVPATKPADWLLGAQLSGGHPKPGGKWVYLHSSFFPLLKDGTVRGFTVGNGVTTATLNYGRFAVDPSDSRRPVVRVGYTK